MIYIGIDPGMKGAVGVVQPTAAGTMISAIDTPIIAGGKKTKDAYDIPAMVNALAGLRPLGELCVYIELVGAMPGQGVTSMFNFGKGYGIWLGILVALKMPYTLVRPASWKKVMMSDMDKEKRSSRLRASQLFPNHTSLFARVKDDGRAEAVLLAEYGRRQQGAGEGISQTTTIRTTERARLNGTECTADC